MITLADWAKRKLDFSDDADQYDPEVSAENAGQVETDCLALLVEDLIGSLQIASRQAQGVALQAAYASRLDHWAAEIARAHEASLAKLKSSVDRQLSALFTPLLGAQLEKKAVTEFCERLGQAIELDSTRQLLISAPTQLQSRISQQLRAHNLDLSFTDSLNDDISTFCGDTEIVAELGKWKSEMCLELIA